MYDARKNQFEIELDKKLSIKEMVTALCHEMVHVKQFARKEMVDGIETGVARWKSKKLFLWTLTIGIYLGKKNICIKMESKWKRNF